VLNWVYSQAIPAGLSFLIVNLCAPWTLPIDQCSCGVVPDVLWSSLEEGCNIGYIFYKTPKNIVTRKNDPAFQLVFLGKSPCTTKVFRAQVLTWWGLWLWRRFIYHYGSMNVISRVNRLFSDISKGQKLCRHINYYSTMKNET